MGGLEGNKLLAGVLVAALIAMVTGIVASTFVLSTKLEKNAYQIAEVKTEASSTPKTEEALPPITPLLAAANVKKGEKAAKKCAACHSFNEGGVNKVGPNLWEIVNASMGKKEGYAYSDALRAMGKTWTYENLNTFLHKPKKYISGTKMNFAGLKKEADRANVIAWMRTLSNNPAPLK